MWAVEGDTLLWRPFIGRPRRPAAGFSLLAALLWAVAARAGEAPRTATDWPVVDDAAIDRLLKLDREENYNVRMVLLPTSVTDKKGRAVVDLRKKDFRLFEDREPREIRYFSGELREPVSVAFLLDVSGSMRQLEKIEHAKEAIRFFVDQLRPGDRFALICFADEQVAWVTEFTEDRERFLRRLLVQVGYGQTALNDAIAAAPALVDAQAQGRRAIVLITDGVDNASRLSIEQAVEIARRVSVPVYAIGFQSVSENLLPKDSRMTGLEVLRYVSTETGGDLFAVSDPEELKEAVHRVDLELRYQYLLGYYPGEDKFDGAFHEIRVETDKRRFNVRTRSGYYGVTR